MQTAGLILCSRSCDPTMFKNCRVRPAAKMRPVLPASASLNAIYFLLMAQVPVSKHPRNSRQLGLLAILAKFQSTQTLQPMRPCRSLFLEVKMWQSGRCQHQV